MKRKMNLRITLGVSILMMLFSGLTVFGQASSTTDVNIALGKTATQSSDMGTPFAATDGLASKAVDGNTDGVFDNGSVTHTACGGQYESGECKGSSNPWWQVDLGAVYQVDKIELWNRTEVPERLTNWRIYVKGETGDWQEFNPGLGVYIKQNPRLIYGSKQARYIKVQLEGEGVFLSLAEVKVFGDHTSGRVKQNQGKANYLITPNSVGDIRLGMTIAEAKKAMSGAKFNDYESECLDFVGTTSISVGGKIIMTFAIDDDTQTIRSITVRDSRYRLANGVHPGTKIKDAEGIFGKISMMTLLYTCFEVADFTNQPKDLRFFMSGGDYSDWNGSDPREQFADKYKSGANIVAIQISNYN
jgi:hypothetical protein